MDLQEDIFQFRNVNQDIGRPICAVYSNNPVNANYPTTPSKSQLFYLTPQPDHDKCAYAAKDVHVID